MKRLSCSFRTELLFSAPVVDHTFAFMLTPHETVRQHVLAHSVTVEPESKLSVYTDGFGNAVHSGYHRASHDRIIYSVQAVVETDESAFDCTAPHPQWRYPSRLTKAGPEIRKFWDQWHLEGAEDEEQALHLMHRLYEHFLYQPGTTAVQTTAEQAMLQGCGVCQDYAHIMLALLRIARIPCIYMSGLMLGEGQTHAWIQAYCGGRWLPLDPTHDRIAGEDYVSLSRGRDFADCSIERGVFHSSEAVNQTQNIYARASEI